MATDKPVIERLELSGFKSIRRAVIDLGRLNVLIGANGAGKSNLLSYFSLLSAAVAGKLDSYVGRHGGPNALMHLGVYRTSEIVANITVQSSDGTRVLLHQRHEFSAPDRLTVALSPGLRIAGDRPKNKVLFDQNSAFRFLFDNIVTYHFLNTGLTSPIRTNVYLEDNRQLRSDAGNLAALLYRYSKTDSFTYQRILSAVRKVAPGFDDFVLEPSLLNERDLYLNWKQVGKEEYRFGPHQLSDGTLRAMALITLFLQPKDDLPDLIIIDEPELGLHPYALTLIAGLMRAASLSTQVLVATQSPTFLDHFTPDEILVAESKDGTSEFRRLDAASLEDWLEDYSVGELWEKNVIGGGPLP